MIAKEEVSCIKWNLLMKYNVTDAFMKKTFKRFLIRDSKFKLEICFEKGSLLVPLFGF